MRIGAAVSEFRASEIRPHPPSRSFTISRFYSVAMEGAALQQPKPERVGTN